VCTVFFEKMVIIPHEEQLVKTSGQKDHLVEKSGKERIIEKRGGAHIEGIVLNNCQ
jgi:hypothetical protein